MKKFGKFIFGTLSLATLAAGAYYLYKNIINKDSSDEFEEFEDEFEDESEDSDEDEPKETPKKDTREYVSINITSDTEKQETGEHKPSTEAAEENEAAD